MSDDRKPLEISYDAASDLLIIDGIRYSGELFRGFAHLELGTWFRIIDRDDGVITLNQPSRPCMYPICRCYDDTTGLCEQAECTWPNCDCGVPAPVDNWAACECCRRTYALPG